jgi:hypothetical protein
MAVESSEPCHRLTVTLEETAARNARPRLMGHSTVLVTMRYLHPNREAKVQAVAKLAANCDNSFTVRTKVQQLVPKVSQSGR